MRGKRRAGSLRLGSERLSKRKSLGESSETPVKERDESVHIQEPVPFEIVAGKPLPTVKNHVFSDHAVLRSIAESGVLATSLQRSREKWLTDGIFERYWIKPSKKKSKEELEKNPPKESMQKLGHSRIKVEPHIFDVTLFAIRDLKPPTLSTAAPAAIPIIQYGVPQSTAPNALPMTHNAPISAASNSQTLSTTPHEQASTPLAHSPAPSSIPHTNTSLSTTPTPVPSQQNQSTSVSNQMSTNAPPVSNILHTPSPLPNQSSWTAGTTPDPPAPPQTKPSQDPVIQMLAQRASTNPDLKVLMKIVASGNANHEQLRIFQSHIDDLTGILQRQQQVVHNPNLALHQAQNSPVPVSNTTQQPLMLHRPAFQTPHNVIPNPNYRPPNIPTPMPMKPKTYTAPKADISGVALEFSAGSGDRFLLPKKSILEYLPSQQEILLSFLLVKKGDHGMGTGYKPEQEYYQPITIRLSADNPKILDAISRSVASYDEVRKYMESTMATAKRVEDANLILTLPKESKGQDNRNASTFLLGDKWQSLKNSNVRPSPGLTLDTKPNKKNKHDDWENTCQFCYTSIPSLQAKDEEGIPICDSCRALRKASKSAVSDVARKAVLPVRHVSGVKTLVF